MLYERWAQIASAHRNEVALRDLAKGEKWTFGELARAADAGEKASDKGICFLRGQGPEFILDLLGAWRSGQIACPLDAGTPPRLARGGSTSQHIRQVAPGEPSPMPTGIAQLKITSATSGEAQLVAFTGAQLAADAENILGTMGLRPDWPNLGIISLAHSYGFSNLVLPLLLHGIPLILVGSALPEAVRKACENEAGLTLAAVPALWKAWDDASAIHPHIRLAISAGAPLSVQLEHRVFARTGLKIHNFYGSSECGGIAYDATSSPRPDGACAGSALRNVKLSLAEDGCLQVRSGAVGETYWPEPAANLQHGTFQTSDLAELKDDVVYLRGRATDQINVAGRKVSPEAIEKVLLSHPQVQDCLVFGVPSQEAERVEEIVGCVVVRETVNCESLRHFLLDHLPAWQVPREWRFVDSLSPNQRGKVSRMEWRNAFLKAGVGARSIKI